MVSDDAEKVYRARRWTVVINCTSHETVETVDLLTTCADLLI